MKDRVCVIQEVADIPRCARRVAASTGVFISTEWSSSRSILSPKNNKYVIGKNNTVRVLNTATTVTAYTHNAVV